MQNMINSLIAAPSAGAMFVFSRVLLKALGVSPAPQLPEQVPRYFKFQGAVDGWEPKWVVPVWPVINVGNKVKETRGL